MDNRALLGLVALGVVVLALGTAETPSLSPRWWASDRARRLGIANEPPADVIPNLQQLAATILDVFGPDVVVTGAYRSPELNAITPNAVDNSLHMQGRAADLAPPPGLALADLLAVAQAQRHRFVELKPYWSDGHLHVAI